MQGVIFNEPERPEARFQRAVPSRIAKWVVNNSQGYIKDEKQADNLLIIASILILLLSAYFIFFGGGPQLPGGIKEVPPQGIPIN